ncbi:MAG: bifunctional pyr operon transcriptional regulator/uracil phosphoribosyltransferase PyrR [Salibacteraceae bacterium]
MKGRTLLNHQALSHTLDRLAYEVYEQHTDFENLAFVSLQPRGVELGERIVGQLRKLEPNQKILHGKLDVTFYRDDFRRREEMLVPSSTEMDFSIEGKEIILIDDVLFTGRTVRSGLDALLDFGRPKHVELLVLIDRRFSRELPVQPDYTGRIVDVVQEERVKVEWSKDNANNRVTLFSEDQ